MEDLFSCLILPENSAISYPRTPKHPVILALLSGIPGTCHSTINCAHSISIAPEIHCHDSAFLEGFCGQKTVESRDQSVEDVTRRGEVVFTWKRYRVPSLPFHGRSFAYPTKDWMVQPVMRFLVIFRRRTMWNTRWKSERHAKLRAGIWELCDILD